MRIINENQDIYTDEHRLYTDELILEWKCPNCGEEHSKELDRDSYYFQCVEANKEKYFYVACINCYENYKFKGKLNVSFEITNAELEEYK